MNGLQQPILQQYECTRSHGQQQKRDRGSSPLGRAAPTSFVRQLSGSRVEDPETLSCGGSKNFTVLVILDPKDDRLRSLIEGVPNIHVGGPSGILRFMRDAHTARGEGECL
jgi:hypothetical protein